MIAREKQIWQPSLRERTGKDREMPRFSPPEDSGTAHAARCALFMLFAWLALAGWSSGRAHAQDAEIISIIGKGDARDTAEAEWRAAAVKQKLMAGAFVRTHESSQMALLLRDTTQIRLHQLSILNIKSMASGGQPTRLDLPQGRAWSQAKQRAPDSTTTQKASTVQILTPSSTIGIRGTDWEVVVDKDGTSTVTVLSGEVELENEHGRVLIAPGEQGRAETGKAPVKLILTNAAERVQWVTAYRAQPRRWVRDLSGDMGTIVQRIETGDFPAALAALAADPGRVRSDVRAALLLADLRISFGETAEALNVLGPHARDGAGDPMASALLARAQMAAGRLDDAGRVLKTAAGGHPDHVELLLARADLARLQGDSDGTRQAATRVLAIDPRNADAWYVIGRLETEREFVKAAREALNRAIEIQPDGPGYKGELATLETFANEFAAASRAFDEALALRPDDYVALTGLGVLQLKRGEINAALQSFLKAGVMEPRYARAWIFSGVAYYQLGDRGRALEAFEKAASLDGKDPLPHLVASLVHYDALELGRAIEAARRAQERLPYLKSLNQVLSDQKGNANLGSALAAFGLEEWSQAYAYDSYSPYWAGSPLFLADRFAGTYNQNSELFRGFLSDPSVFGASNRFSSIVPVPGHYGSLGFTASRDYISEARASASVNGYSVSTVPFSYFVGFDTSHGDSRINSTNADGRMHADQDNLVVGLGMRPTHELGLFAFANRNETEGRIADRNGPTDDAFSIDYHRYDAGFNYKFTPTNQVWFKAGDGKQSQSVAGAFFSPDLAALGVQPMGTLRAFRTDVSQRDAQLRHTFDVNPDFQLSWGVEYAQESRPFSTSLEFLPLRVDLSQDNSLKAWTGYVSGRLRLAPALDVQLDLHYQEMKSRFEVRQSGEVVGIGTLPPLLLSGEARERELNPRVGLKWQPAEGHTLRAAAQAWRRPPGVNTLAPIDTMGIALDDQIERPGGRLTRARLQYEITLDTATFVQAYADMKRVKNPDNPGGAIIPALDLDQLEQLRNRKRVYGLRQDYLEHTPKFGAGEIDSYGLAMNRLVSRDLTLAARYIYTDTRNTTAAFRDRAIPYHPEHYANLAANWQWAPRWIVGPVATYRSSRFTDEANATPLSAGWAFGLHAYWESDDKRWSVGGLIDQIHSDKQSSIYRHPVLLLQGTYRF